MDEILSLTVLLQILIPLGGLMRILLCFVYMSIEEDPAPYKRRIRNVLIIIALSECIGTVLRMTLGYFGGTVIPY